MTIVIPHPSLELDWSRVDSFAGNFTSDALTAARPCPICGGLDSRTVLRLEDVQFFSDSNERPKRVDIVERRCERCFAIYLDPCYTPYAYEVIFAEIEQSYGALSGRADEQIRWLGGRGLLEPGSETLDVGCYDGHFLGRIPDSVRRVGLDIDETAVERGRRLYGARGIEFVCGDFETFAYDGRPDTITMFHVLEHLPRPAAALARLRSIAHERTRLVVEVPILEIAATNDLTGFFSPQHATHFTRASLRSCLAGAGWSPADWHEAADYNGCRVVARPVDPSPFTCGDPADAVALDRYLAHWHGAVADVAERALRIPDERVVVWGAGMHTEFLHRLTPFFQAHPGREYVLVDSDPVKQGTAWRGIRVYAPEDAVPAAAAEGAWLLASSYRNTQSLRAAAIELGMAPERIVMLYEGTPRLY